MPRVSICIPAYNPDYFELCLRSALAQSFVDAEILVSDDCPTDAIKVICDKYVRFVQYSRNPNPGPESNVRRLVQIANGEYIKFLFDDDVLHPFAYNSCWRHSMRQGIEIRALRFLHAI
ncbi:glycosyltransferase family 2 protein (plasmid) [Rhizobium leguminosarum]|nr:glycosyltransferase family 2 protein [Rhizobium leguminosarum]